MDALLARAPQAGIAADLLLRHCLAFDLAWHRGPSARVRLEEALGPELARRLVRSLTVGSRG